LSDRLRLDRRTQAPVVEQILVDASNEAAPIVQQLLQIRQQLVNLELNNQAAEIQTALQQHTAAAAKLAAIEAAAFAKIYGELKENQRERAAEAFRIMGGIFYPGTTPAAGGGRGGR
jgi:hypothetical protein